MSQKVVSVGGKQIGGGNPILVQSMTNTPTIDAEKTLSQINELVEAGCDIVRLAVSNEKEVISSKNIINEAKVPLVADIQFDYKLAIACADIGFSKIRFNPGNIGNESKVKEVVVACKRNNVPIRVGVNGGSLDKEIAQKYKGAEALCESALSHVRILEKHGFYDTVISVKSSDVRTMVEAYRLIAKKCDYPLHLGVTESGAKIRGIIKSSIGIGALLLDGIGDTIRVSLTGNPVEEVKTAKMMLRSLGLSSNGVEIVSCPTCSRCEYDMERIAVELEDKLSNITQRIKVAVMGCIVNGKGESADADVAVCGGKGGKVAIFFKGEPYKTATSDTAISEVMMLIEKLCKK